MPFNHSFKCVWLMFRLLEVREEIDEQEGKKQYT